MNTIKFVLISIAVVLLTALMYTPIKVLNVKEYDLLNHPEVDIAIKYNGIIPSMIIFCTAKVNGSRETADMCVTTKDLYFANTDTLRFWLHENDSYQKVKVTFSNHNMSMILPSFTPGFIIEKKDNSTIIIYPKWDLFVTIIYILLVFLFIVGALFFAKSISEIIFKI